MTFAVTPLVGINTDQTYAVGTVPPFNLGLQVFGADGKRYVFGKAGAAITASTTACAVNTSTFSVAASGGSYTSPAVAMASGDFGWFGAASV
jgi:hypothetical protein